MDPAAGGITRKESREMKRYKDVDLDDAVAGMALYEDVRDGQGGVLLPAHTVLSDAMLTSLRRRGIDTLCIVNADVAEEELAAERERVQQRLTSLFRKCNAERACQMLLQHVTDYRMDGLK
jgi:hypothetical protein